jgi:N-acetylglucosaminyldiphosphoundecaprenol N-acetyl-beta-D-mannosaminyltransferase
MATTAIKHDHSLDLATATDPVPIRYVRLTGARFAAVTQAEAVDRIVGAAGLRRGLWTITANLDHLRRYCREDMARELLDGADLVVADGMAVIWASRLVGASLPERVAGSSMIWEISDAARRHRQSIFLLGGNPGTAERAAQVLAARYEGLEIAGTLCPPMGFEDDPAELADVVRETTEARPQIVFVALGFPKQDVLIKMLRSALPSASFVGVGIGLSFVTGEVARAPSWVGGLGMEWLFRLLQEPTRLARRYLFDGIPFAVRFLSAATFHRIRSAPPDAGWG